MPVGIDGHEDGRAMLGEEVPLVGDLGHGILLGGQALEGPA